MNSKISRRELDIEPKTAAADLKWQIIGEIPERQSQRFRRTEHTFTVRLEHNLNTFSNVYEVAEAVDSMYEKIMQPYLEKAGERDVFSVAIKHKDLGKDIFIPPRRKFNFNREEFLRLRSLMISFLEMVN